MAQRRWSFLLLSLLLVTLLIGSGVAAQMPTASSSSVHLPLIVGGGMAPTPTTPPAITGYMQKGPFIQGSSITVRELDSNFNPTGRTLYGEH